ncbi:hypothetical protein [Actinomyces faecalis]|uniref:hypothetical protein n=1 Tax=Actinomyces faecalis TaxID=2722820 RepID=UPI0015559F66|nr:hypothetical protein [Actinomyces faecalis]
MDTEVTHQWVVTVDGQPPARSRFYPLAAASYADAVAEYAHDAAAYGMPPVHAVAFWYRLTTITHTQWVPVDADTDYRPLIDAAARALSTTTSTRIIGDHPTQTGM